MSRWMHSCCDKCWTRREGERVCHRIKDAEKEICCFCGVIHSSGIRVRENWAFTLCRGEIGIHAPASQEAKA